MTDDEVLTSLKKRLFEVEEALADYVHRYGFTPRARVLFLGERATDLRARPCLDAALYDGLVDDAKQCAH